MMPMVFCASLRPWEKPMKPDDTICTLAKIALTTRGRDACWIFPPREDRNDSSANSRPMIVKPSRKPAAGDTIIGSTTLLRMPLPSHQCSPGIDQMMTCQFSLAAANAAPIRPPISACDELDGRPHHQVIRSQIVAPSNAQISSSGVIVTTTVSIRPDEIVLATAVPHIAPSRLVNAASNTACPGLSTLVATTVAMELAVSWKPLMYSKTSATSSTVKTRVRLTEHPWWSGRMEREDGRHARRRPGRPAPPSPACLLPSPASRVLQHNRVNHVAGIAAAIDRLLQQFEQVLAQQQARGVLFVGEQLAIEREDQAVGLALDRLHAVVQRLHLLDAHAFAQLRHHLDDDAGCLLEHCRARRVVHVHQLLGEQRVALGEFLDRLRNLVQRRRQRLDVLAFERGDERVDQFLADLAHDFLFTAARQAEFVERRAGRLLVQHRDQGARALPRRVGARF